MRQTIGLSILCAGLAACGGTPDGGNGGNGGNGGGNGSNGSVGSSSFTVTAMATSENIAAASDADAELDYSFSEDYRVLRVRLSDGEDFVALSVRDESMLGANLAPGDYEIFGTGAGSQGMQGSTDVDARLGGQEYYVNQSEGTLTVEAHSNQRLRGRVVANIQRTGSSTPSHELEASFDARYPLPSIEGLASGEGLIRFGETTVNGTARVEDEGDTVRVFIENEEGTSFRASIPKIDGALRPGVYGGANTSVGGQRALNMGSINYTGNASSSVDVVSVANGVLAGQMNFVGRSRSSSGGGSSATATAQFRAPLQP